MKKRTFLMLSASMFMAAGLVACNKEREGSAAEDKGDPTTATLTLSFKKAASTRAVTTSDPNATNDEVDVKSADVYIYTESGAYLTHTTLSAADFADGTDTSSADVVTSSTTIPTTTGVKNVLVGVNLPTATATAMEGQSMSAASTAVQTIARTQIAATLGLPMFSVQATRQQIVDDPTANKVIVTVQRIVAKVTVEKDPAMVTTGTPGTLGNLEWAINNQNTKYFLIQGRSPSYPDPNWASGSYVATDFAAATATDYVAVANGPQAIGGYVPLYALENTSNDKTQKELTRVTVRSTFSPSSWVATGGYTSGQTTDPATTAKADTTPVTFYTVTASAGATTYYFQSQTDANNYATDKGVAAKTYTDGICYWNIFLNKASGFGQVYRNDYYKCNITRVVAPGQNGDGLTTPDAEVEASTNITVDVDILYWNPVAMENEELVP